MSNVFHFGHRVDAFESGFADTQPDPAQIESDWDSGNMGEPVSRRSGLWKLLVSESCEFALFLSAAALVVAMITAPAWWPL